MSLSESLTARHPDALPGGRTIGEMALVLIVEDERSLAESLELFLRSQGFRTERAHDGEAALTLFRAARPDLVLLDVMLPKLDGLEVLKRIRAETKTPVIMLTAKAEEIDKLLGLGLGADDYLVKPFSIEELLARVRAHLRRVNPAVTGEVRVADLVMNLDGRESFRDGRRVELSAKEFELLELFARSPGKVFNRFEIEEKVWPEYTGGSNVVDVYVRYLRRKLGHERIETVRGAGYRLVAGS